VYFLLSVHRQSYYKPNNIWQRVQEAFLSKVDVKFQNKWIHKLCLITAYKRNFFCYPRYVGLFWDYNREFNVRFEFL
jgi:hypothetical protein